MTCVALTSSVAIYIANTSIHFSPQELAKQNILSAPVVLSASALEDDESGTYMGMFDIRDMLTRIIDGRPPSCSVCLFASRS